MTFGEFTDMGQNKITLYPSSDVRPSFWMRIENAREKKEATAQLSANDARVLIALLTKVIGHLEDWDK